MPLILLGLIVIIGIVAYWYIGKQNSDNPLDPREVRERYSRSFEDKAKDVGDEVKKAVRKRAGIFDVDYDVEEEDNTIPFPQDVEREKRKRDIH